MSPPIAKWVGYMFLASILLLVVAVVVALSGNLAEIVADLEEDPESTCNGFFCGPGPWYKQLGILLLGLTAIFGLLAFAVNRIGRRLRGEDESP